MRRLSSSVIATWVVLACAACGEDQPACFAGDHRACACASGAAGYQACSASGDGYERCVCDGRTPGLDGSVEAAASDGGAGDAALASFMQPCQTNADCATDLCFPFNAKGPYCSKPCKDSSECEAPSTGCNNQGVCKVP
jgi:hypothetical protein